ncbi:hypothetical protein TNCV_3843171 [Trichonephila clavipes]|nr:hypothetical protein TNCV_3843171 [Trichonephila clavipes]
MDGLSASSDLTYLYTAGLQWLESHGLIAKRSNGLGVGFPAPRGLGTTTLRPSDELAPPPSPNFYTTPTGGRLSFDVHGIPATRNVLVVDESPEASHHRSEIQSWVWARLTPPFISSVGR